MIDGVIITPLKQIHDDRGKVMHMMREDSPVFIKFGEIYFSCVNPGAIKAWKRHKKMTMNCAVIYGEMKFVLYDDRANSSTKGMIQELILTPNNYCLITVPPLVWNGSLGLGNDMSILANCATITHASEESEHKLFSDSTIPYNWTITSRCVEETCR